MGQYDQVSTLLPVNNMARRVGKHVVDWVTLSNRVPEAQKEAFRVFRTSFDKYALKVNQLPEELPKIDFDMYNEKIANKAMVAEFQKMYTAMQIPYPTDVTNVKAAVEKEEKISLEKMKTYIADQEVKKADVMEIVNMIDSVPPPEKMSERMFNHYFPNMANNPNAGNPGFMPQTNPDAQIDKFPGIRYNAPNDYSNFFAPLDKEREESVHFAKLEQQKGLEGGKKDEQIEAPKK